MTGISDQQPSMDPTFGLDDERVARCLDGRASADDVRAVEARLLSDAAFRAGWLRLTAVDGLLREQGQDGAVAAEPLRDSHGIMVASAAVLPSDAVRPAARSHIPRISLLAMLAVAMVSAAVTSVAAAVISRESSWSQVLMKDGFEPGTTVQVTGLPGSLEAWSGDFAQVVTTTDSVTPIEGAGMLQLLQGDYDGKPIARGFSSNQHRLIDLRPYRDRLAGGLITLEFSAAFNRGAAASDAPAHSRDQCSVGLFALTSAMANDARLSEPGQLRDLSLAYAHCRHLDLDDDPRTWQQTTTELRLPPDTDFVLMHVGVNEHPPLERDGPVVFPAHFCDDVRATLYERLGGR